jgi:hypothetical protein
MKKLRNWIAAMVFVATLGGTTLTLATPQVSFAACSDRLLTFPAWYRGLLDGGCEIQNPGTVGLSKFIWTIALNIVEVMLQLVGYISVGFIIAGGFKYMISTGDASRMTKAKNTILNAVIGLAISIASVGIVNVVAGAIY